MQNFRENWRKKIGTRMLFDLWYTTRMNKELSPGIDYIGITTPFYCVDGKGHLLLHKRSQNCRDEQGRWDAGGGQLEFGETPEEGVLREIKEEYNCDGEILGQIPPISIFRKQNGLDTHWLAIPYIVKVNPKEAHNNEPHKIEELGWFTLDNLPSPLHSALEKDVIKTDRIEYIKKYI